MEESSLSKLPTLSLLTFALLLGAMVLVVTLWRHGARVLPKEENP